MSVLKQVSCSATLSSIANGKEITDRLEGGADVLSVAVQVGEGDRSNTCSLTIYDPGLKWGAKYRSKSLAIGGIRVPLNLLEKPETAQTDTGAGGSVNLSGLPDKLSGDALAIQILKYCRSVNVTDIGQQAYILASVEHESSMGQTVEEIGGSSAWYAPYFGRGLIQLTHRSNYEKAGQKLGRDFVANPNELLLPKYSIPIAVLGCRDGWFTGVKLSDFISGSRRDFIGARAIVNGTDRASLIAGYAQRWLGRIPSLLPQVTASPAGTSAAPATAAPQQFAPAGLVPQNSQTPIDDAKKAIAAAQKPEVVPPDAVEITVIFSSNYSDEVVSFSFYLIATNSSTETERTTFTGRGVRFLIGNSRSRSTLKNISLRQIAERIGEKIGADVVIPNTPAAEKINKTIAQNGETDYQFLLRLAQSVGYTVKEEAGKDGSPPKLTLVEAKSGAVIKADKLWISALQTSDEASNDRVLLATTPVALQQSTAPPALPKITELADGEKIGEGYSTELAVPNPAIAQLKIQPGSILDVQADIAPEPFARDYRIKALSWAWDGRLTGAIALYIPVNVKPKPKEQKSAAAETTAAAGGQSLTPTAGTGSQFSLPGLTGRFDTRMPIVQGGALTWGDATHGGQRIPSSPQITQNIILMASRFQQIVVPVLQGKRPTITSFYRPEPYNSAAGGAVGSLHLTGRALDFYVDAMPGTSLHAALDPIWTGGLGFYSDGRVHIDIGAQTRFDGG